jgi:hypothetical protein
MRPQDSATRTFSKKLNAECDKRVPGMEKFFASPVADGNVKVLSPHTF